MTTQQDILDAQEGAPGASAGITMMFHPTLVVDDLDEANDWFEKVFGGVGVKWEEKWDITRLNPAYPINYSTFFHLGQVVLDVLCPGRLTLPNGNAAPYPKGQGLIDIAWHTPDVAALALRLQKLGVRCRDQNGEVVSDGQVPVSNLTSDVFTIWTNVEHTGLVNEFMEIGEAHLPYYSEKGDPRLGSDWVLTEPSPRDPIGIVTCSHHTVLTSDIGRAIGFYQDILGGVVVDRSRDAAWDAETVVVHVADSFIELAAPRGGLMERPTVGDPRDDVYAGIAFAVRDVATARDHVVSCGIDIVEISGGFQTRPAQTYGVTWRFLSTDAAYAPPTPRRTR